MRIGEFLLLLLLLDLATVVSILILFGTHNHHHHHHHHRVRAADLLRDQQRLTSSLLRDYRFDTAKHHSAAAAFLKNYTLMEPDSNANLNEKKNTIL